MSEPLFKKPKMATPGSAKLKELIIKLTGGEKITCKLPHAAFVNSPQLTTQETKYAYVCTSL
eukprot:SAG31_NODE_2971_length_4839_cov_1.617722_7_plen_62_part_00